MCANHTCAVVCAAATLPKYVRAGTATHLSSHADRPNAHCHSSERCSHRCPKMSGGCNRKMKHQRMSGSSLPRMTARMPEWHSPLTANENAMARALPCVRSRQDWRIQLAQICVRFAVPCRKLCRLCRGLRSSVCAVAVASLCAAALCQQSSRACTRHRFDAVERSKSGLTGLSASEAASAVTSGPTRRPCCRFEAQRRVIAAGSKH